MLKKVFRGILAGAIGTVALNVATYLDMGLRGRASSDAPAKLVTILAEKAGLSLGSTANEEAKKTVQNRASGLGALLGYLTGLGIGGLYGLLSSVGKLPLPIAGVSVGLSAMAASDTPLITFGISNPDEWGASDWAADIIPHLVYGLVTAAAYEALGERAT